MNCILILPVTLMFQFQDTTIINLDKIFIDKISQIRKKVIKINVKIVENIQMNCF
jgi:hypothetical protein